MLKEPAIGTDDFGASVAGQSLEILGAVDDGMVGMCGVAEGEGYATV